MNKTKKDEFRSMTNSEIENMEKDIRKKMMDIRFKNKVEKSDNPMQIRNMKKEIAVLKTILRERELNQA